MSRKSFTASSGPRYLPSGDINPHGPPDPRARDALLYFHSNSTSEPGGEGGAHHLVQQLPPVPHKKESGPFFRLSSQILRSQQRESQLSGSIDENWLASGASVAGYSAGVPGAPDGPQMNGSGPLRPPQQQQVQATPTPPKVSGPRKPLFRSPRWKVGEVGRGPIRRSVS